MTGSTVGRRRFRRCAAAVVLAAFVVACTTARTVDVRTHGDLAEEIRAGDRVVVTTHAGRELAFEVVRVEPDALVGAEERVERDQIARLEVTRTDALRTAGLAGGGVLTFLLIVGLVAAAVAPAAILGASGS
ncbi:MAG TPA: hypothetical protein VFG47_23705 [Geminicoccaceae bacterium]|nr:hypothetical protein [Geminicoccaceae bacterium]